MTQIFKVYRYNYGDWFYIADSAVCANYLWQDGNIYNHVIGLCKGRWTKKYVAQKFLMDYERKQMQSYEFIIHKNYKAGYWIGVCGKEEYLWQDGNIYNHVIGFGTGYWELEDDAERFLTKYKEKQMSENKIKLDQVTKDIGLLVLEQTALNKKIEDEKKRLKAPYIFRLGDVS